MNVWRYQIRERLEIDAPVERVYTLASDPEIVPSYVPEIARIEVVRRLGEHMVLVRSHLKVAGLTFGFGFWFGWLLISRRGSDFPKWRHFFGGNANFSFR